MDNHEDVNSWLFPYSLFYFYPTFIYWQYAHTVDVTVPYGSLISEHNIEHPLFTLSDILYIKNITNPIYKLD